MKIVFMEGNEGLIPYDVKWRELADSIKLHNADVLITNEMPFGNWLACDKQFDSTKALKSITLHNEGLHALSSLEIDTVLSSQPLFDDEKLVNEAFVLDHKGYRRAHHKHYFPQEPSFFEATWFGTTYQGFNVIESNGLKIGFLLCTELMFNEWARAYRRQGAHLIVVPRASGQSMVAWKAAAAMAAVVSGCYLVSSNRVGQAADGFLFGGKGFAFAPNGTLIAETSAHSPVLSFDLDVNRVQNQQKQYPCYVKELK